MMEDVSLNDVLTVLAEKESKAFVVVILLSRLLVQKGLLTQEEVNAVFDRMISLCCPEKEHLDPLEAGEALAEAARQAARKARDNG